MSYIISRSIDLICRIIKFRVYCFNFRLRITERCNYLFLTIGFVYSQYANAFLIFIFHSYFLFLMTLNMDVLFAYITNIIIRIVITSHKLFSHFRDAFHHLTRMHLMKLINGDKSTVLSAPSFSR